MWRTQKVKENKRWQFAGHLTMNLQSGLHHTNSNVPYKTSNDKFFCIQHFVTIQWKSTAKNTAEGPMTVANRIIAINQKELRNKLDHDNEFLERYNWV